ncbi:MAG: ABC transporter permease [Acidobacteriota bacterium]
MSNWYRDLAVRADPERLAIQVSVSIGNFTAATWRAEEGFAFGFQVFDPESDTLIADGPHCPVPRDLAPGDAEGLDLEIELPAEPGRYRIFISPLQEDVCWYYQRGGPFLLIDAEVAGGRARLLRARVFTARLLAWERWSRALGRAFKYPVASMWRNRGLIRSMVRRDILGRYRGSFAGLFWTVLNPLLLMITYFFVFGIVLRTRFGGDPSRAGFVLYFLAGMLPWLAFSEAAGRAPFVIFEHRNFVKKLVFPLETLPVNLVVAGLVTELFALAIFTAGLLLARGAVPLSVLWLPVLLVPQVLFTAGVCWLLAALSVYLRDLGQVSGFLLTLWFFLTPICYPVESLPQAALPLLSKNPLYVLVRGYRAIFLETAPPPFNATWKLWLLSALVFLAGHALFYKLKKTFADVI